METVVKVHFDAILGACALFLATAFAWLLAVHSSRALKRSEVTSQLIQLWFGLEYSRIRVEVLRVARRVFHENDYSDLDWLVNKGFKDYTAGGLESLTETGVMPGANVVLFLYFFVELTANFDMGLLDRRIIRRVFCSQYELTRPLLAEICEYYKKQASKRPKMVTPPWVEMLPKLDKIMGVNE